MASQVMPRPMLPKPVKTPKKRRSGLRRMSDKLRKSTEIYNKVTKPLWLKLHPGCQFVLTPGASCGKPGIPHHKKGRGKNLNDMRFFMTACQEHHDWIHFKHPALAYKLGYLLPKWK